MTNKKYIDLSYLEDVSMGDKSMIEEMIEMFLDLVPQSLSELRSLYEDEQWLELKAEAHKLKPNFAYMGIESGKELLQQIEHHADKEEDLESIREKLDELEKIYEQAAGELNSELKGLKEG